MGFAAIGGFLMVVSLLVMMNFFRSLDAVFWIATGVFVLGVIVCFLPFFLPKAGYNEPELIFEVRLSDDNVTNFELAQEDTNIEELIKFGDYSGEVEYELNAEITNWKFVDSDLTDAVLIQIYKSTPEESAWKLISGRETKYSCVILW